MAAASSIPNGPIRGTHQEPVEEDEVQEFRRKSNWEFMRQSFYQTSLLVFSVGCCISVIGAYYLFNEFVKPLLWAIICGITLYPLKRKLTKIVKLWLDGLLSSRTPLVVGLVTCPLKIVDHTGDFLLDTIHDNRSLVVGLLISFPALSMVLHFQMVPKTVNVLLGTLGFIDQMVYACASPLWVSL